MSSSAKKAKVDGSDAGKKWSEQGPEQKELDSMVEHFELDDTKTPNEIRLSSPMFRQFSARVFAAYLRKTKAKYGYCGKVYCMSKCFNSLEKESFFSEK